MFLPKIIQGGMGVAISDWKLANAVSLTGHLGVVSGTGLSVIFSSRLQDGDLGGHMRRAMSHFPFQDIVERVLNRYYVKGGIHQDQSYRRPPQWKIKPARDLVELTVLANFVEIFLAKEGHSNPVGINLLEKIQMPTLASLYGAMLAGVDYVLMGAGIPIQIPEILDRLAKNIPVSYRIDVLNAKLEHLLHFDPRELFPSISVTLKRPFFFPIISSFVLAQALLKRATGIIDGFIVETPIAGGHNAPPRGPLQLNDKGEPIYGEKDEIDVGKLKGLGFPIWLAGGYGSAEKLAEALALGAAGIQVGTAFAYCNESGMADDLKLDVLRKVLDEDVRVHTSPVVSPTGFPFKVVQTEDTLSDPAVYEARQRVCDIGFLRHQIEQDDGSLIYRCSAEQTDAYVSKGGNIEDTSGRTCLCNCLIATAGFGQRRRNGYQEPAMVTSGDSIVEIRRFMKEDSLRYSAADVIAVLEQGLDPGTT
ncbi:MAG: nitronate monooxygenase [Anaerolineae bacterium]|nr:nitronate monooxygenase [Anaerolineae bacterium]